MILGIDPGLSGALALIDKNGIITEIWDMPTSAATYGKGNIINGKLLANIMGKAKPKRVCIEQVSAMPGQGVTSMFKFGVGFGLLQGCAAAFSLPVDYVRPQEWKKPFGLIKKGKDAARTLAISKYPHIAEDLSRKKDIGRADAVLIALYAYSTR